MVEDERAHQNGGVFMPEDGDVLRERLLSMASSDDRVVGGAVLGSLARGAGDEWSDLDIMFAVAEGLSVSEVLDDWTVPLARDLGATKLFDLPSGAAVYRVFLLRSSLELDLSMTPASEFRPTGPSFRTSSTSQASVAGSTGTTAEDSMSCLATSLMRATVHWLHRSRRRSSGGRFPMR